MPTYRLRVELELTDDQLTQYRADHALTTTDDPRPHLAGTVRDELTGLGEDRGWWHTAHVT